MNWFEVYQFVERWARSSSSSGDVFDWQLPIAGTPRWCDLPDQDARKLMAVLLGGVREALANDARQEAIAEAGREISTAAPWSQIAHRQLQRAQWEQTHPWARPARKKAS